MAESYHKKQHKMCDNDDDDDSRSSPDTAAATGAYIATVAADVGCVNVHPAGSKTG